MAYTSVKISANSSDYQSQMKSAAAQMKVLSAEYTTAATKAKLFGSETDSLKAKAESLTQKITVQKGIVQLNSEQQEKLTKKLSEQKTKQEELNREPFSKSTRCHVSHGIADAVSRLAIVRASVAIRTLTGRLLPRFGFNKMNLSAFRRRLLSVSE